MERLEREIKERDSEGTIGKWGISRAYRNDDGLIEYVCRHMDVDASLDDVNWHIWKYSYTGNDWDVIQERVGSVEGKDDLGW